MALFIVCYFMFSKKSKKLNFFPGKNGCKSFLNMLYMQRTNFPSLSLVTVNFEHCRVFRRLIDALETWNSATLEQLPFRTQYYICLCESLFLGHSSDNITNPINFLLNNNAEERHTTTKQS